MWLVAHKNCSTTVLLAWCSLPHPEKCPLCDQDNETLDHLLFCEVFSTNLVSAPPQGWSANLAPPQPDDTSFDDSYTLQTNDTVVGWVSHHFKGLSSHHNCCLLHGVIILECFCYVLTPLELSFLIGLVYSVAPSASVIEP